MSTATSSVLNRQNLLNSESDITQAKLGNSSINNIDLEDENVIMPLKKLSPVVLPTPITPGNIFSIDPNYNDIPLLNLIWEGNDKTILGTENNGWELKFDNNYLYSNLLEIKLSFKQQTEGTEIIIVGTVPTLPEEDNR
jgi:hypothetical protein